MLIRSCGCIYVCICVCVLGLLSGARVSRLGIQGDEVHGSVVEGVVHVEYAARLLRRHAEALVVGREVRQLFALVRVSQTSRVVAVYTYTRMHRGNERVCGGGGGNRCKYEFVN